MRLLSYQQIFLLFFVLSTLAPGTFARSLGVIGDTFPVLELSFLDYIESRLKTLNATGELDALNARWVSAVREHANRPTPVMLRRAHINQSHVYEPSIVLSQDVLGDRGQVLFHKGTKVNALKNLPFYQPHWLLFDADDEAQVRWARHMLSQFSSAKVILTKGEISRMEHELQKEIFFDQAGRIIKQLGIQQVPAHVMRDGDVLRIEEIAIGEDGYAR